MVYRLKKLVSDKNLPGTLNTQCVIPVAVMALAFMSVIKVDLGTLTICIIAQVLGSYLGPDLIAKFSATTIRWIVGVGLLLTASFILASQLSLIAAGGIANELDGWKLIFAAVFMFIFGVLNNIGIGSYQLAIATLYSLGMSPASAFPIMMGASALSTPISSLKIIKYGQYNREITLFASVFGIIGVLAGVFLIKTLDVSQLKYIIIVVLFYTGVNMIYKELNN